MHRQDWQDIVWFLRPSLGVLACFGVAIALTYQLSQERVNQLESEFEELTSAATEVVEFVLPHPKFSPREVVQIQTRALKDKNRERGVLQCATFASPDNFKVTGPIDQFATIVRGGDFQVLSSPQVVTIGKPTFERGHARIIVTALSQDAEVYAFVWVLQQLESGRWKDCWMTDAVFPIRPKFEPPHNDV